MRILDWIFQPIYEIKNRPGSLQNPSTTEVKEDVD
jgi:hypothetical protein